MTVEELKDKLDELPVEMTNKPIEIYLSGDIHGVISIGEITFDDLDTVFIVSKRVKEEE